MDAAALRTWAPVALFAIAAATLWGAALMPQFFPVWTQSADPLDAIAAHPHLWRANATLFASSAAATVAAVGALIGSRAAHPLAWPTIAMFVVAAALWIAHNCFRGSAMIAVALDRTPERVNVYTVVDPWMAALWIAASALIIAGFAGLGGMILLTGATAAWAGWLTLASAAASLILLLAIRDVPPVVAYLPLVPLAVATAIDAVQYTASGAPARAG